MHHHPFTPTPEQRANLERLAAHLDLGVTNMDFDMERFSDFDVQPYETHECGTVACAVGHGPSLGIAAHEGEAWLQYAKRAFFGDSAFSYDWLFSGIWKLADNSPRGAAARIRYALKNGTPDNALEQAIGEAPLSYTIPARVEAPAVKMREKV